MYDPHELLEYLYSTGRIRVPQSEIAKLSSKQNDILTFEKNHVCTVFFECPKPKLYPQVCCFQPAIGSTGITGHQWQMQDGLTVIRAKDAFQFLCMGMRLNTI